MLRWSGNIKDQLGLGDLRHGIHAIFDRRFTQSDDVEAVSRKLPTQEEVHEVNLDEDVGQIQDFAEDELGDVQVVGSEDADEVVGHCVSPVLLRVGILKKICEIVRSKFIYTETNVPLLKN